MRQYVMSAPVFARKSAFNSVDDPLLYELHPWIATALEEDKKLVANPKKPSVLAYKHDELHQLEDSHMGPLQKGDIVWMSFTLFYAIGHKDWRPEVKPMEIVHVGRLADFPASQSDPSAYPEVDHAPLQAGQITLPTGGMYKEHVKTFA